jgi:PKD repeat protein
VLAPRSGNIVGLTADQPIIHIYPQIGEYIASLTVVDDDGNTDTDTVRINAGTYPEAIAMAYPTVGTAPLTVRFAANGNSPNGTIEYFHWDFDGNGSTDWTTRISENKEYTFQQPGIYSATLTVTDNRGYIDVKEVTITVQASNDAPVVFVSPDPAEGNAPLDVTLTGLARDADGTIVNHEWDFEGDGTYDYTSTVSGITAHQYTDIGVYTATLRVTDNDGNQGTGTCRIEVKVTGAPTAKVEASVTHGAAALGVQFTGTGSQEETIVKYEWDFDGDGTYDVSSTDTGNAEYVYTLPGSFTAILRVTDAAGLTDTASVNILVTAGITASLGQDSFDPSVGETIDINSVLTASATVTIRVTDRTGKILRTLVKDVSREPGYYSDTWDGKDEGDQVLASGAYLYVIEYETGGQTYRYDLTNTISPDIAKITPTYPTTFNPLNAETNFFRYELDTKSEVTVYISPFRGGAMDRIKTLVLRQPQKAGNYVLTWDGTDDAGNLVASESYVLAVFRWYLPENAIIINNRPVISDPLVNPAYFNPDALPYSDENQTIMSYTLSKQADIALTIYDGLNYIVKQITKKDVPAGPGNIIQWDGKNTQGQNVTPGVYRTKLIATDANGNKSYDANALLIIFY